ncbi:hypothetical protein CI238_01917 [Colletotrichum incanum]|uniref:Uncharacterized protein n=1 Tax=Colletotrichum incanum TaxID=1573173 RepID=A0A167B4E8_COLIC|nr:hypothetical protein CI238_01917 [Colletotrichum incanum]
MRRLVVRHETTNCRASQQCLRWLGVQLQDKEGSKNLRILSPQSFETPHIIPIKPVPLPCSIHAIMPSATTNQATTNVGPTNGKVVQLFYLCSLFAAVNESCKDMNNITYSSANSDNDRAPTPFQVFLCKLAQICDTEKGGDTITALVALRGANGPAYRFASNNRKKTELDDTKKFLSDLLDFVGKNPDGLAEKPLKKQVLWRILEFNFPRVDWYLKRVVISIGECIEKSLSAETQDGSDIVLQLRQIEAKASFPRDMSSGYNARPKFLSDCETLMKAIHYAKETGFNKAMNERASVGDSEAVHSWCELRHYLGRLLSYRQAADSIVGAYKKWPELFTDFTVEHIPSSRLVRLSLPKPTLSPMEVIPAAFPDMNVDEYASHIEQLRDYNLDGHIQDKLRQKPMRQLVHCEVHLQNFLVRTKMAEPDDYWNKSMFIATSKPPCRLCRYYFNDPENDFLVQSSHMNVYSKWRLPDIYEGQDENTLTRQEELLDDIIEQMQQDTLHIVREQLPQWKRNDSRTDSWTGQSAMLGNGQKERSDTRNSGRVSTMSGASGWGMRTERHHFESPSSDDDSDYDNL